MGGGRERLNVLANGFVSGFKANTRSGHYINYIRQHVRAMKWTWASFGPIISEQLLICRQHGVWAIGIDNGQQKQQLKPTHTPLDSDIRFAYRFFDADGKTHEQAGRVLTSPINSNLP